ncbi:MAG: NfeD family protein [Oscillospiraceae bacterium]|nr:NfeD family protein [Oscillospiraceae bacterium]
MQKGHGENMDWFSEFWGELDLLRQVLYCIAVPGTLILIIQTILMVFGIGGESAEFDVPEVEAADLTTTGADGFGIMGLFTFQGIVAFFCVFGWSGIVVMNASGSTLLSLFLAFVFGFAAMYGVAKVIRLMTRLAVSGTIKMNLLIGETGTVYIPIPEDGTKRGKVNIQLAERIVECDAISETGALATNTPVRVTDIIGGNVLVVEKM